MRILKNHISREVLHSTILVALALCSLDFLLSAIDEQGNTRGAYNNWMALKYVIMIFPRHLYDLLPFVALIGSLVGLGRMAANNELVAMQTAGLTLPKLVGAALRPAVLLMFLGLALGEWVVPVLETKAVILRAQAKDETVGFSATGHWVRNHNVFMHFNAITPTGGLLGVRFLQFDDEKRLILDLSAESATYMSGNTEVISSNDQPIKQTLYLEFSRFSTPNIAEQTQLVQPDKWQLTQVTQRLFEYGDEGLQRASSRQDESQLWQLDLSPDLLKVNFLQPDLMPLGELYRVAKRYERQGQDARKLYLGLWQKLFQPFTTATLVVLAASFIFGPLRGANMGGRLFSAISAGIVFSLVQRLCYSLGLLLELTPVLIAVLPIMLTATLAVIILRRAS
jgi:lipopolysaccharide export system permease protein